MPCNVGALALVHNTRLGDSPAECGNFSAVLKASDSGCYTSTLTVTASPELNGTVACENSSENVAGNATILGIFST